MKEVRNRLSTEKIDHIGIAVRSIEERLPYYRDVLGLEYLAMKPFPNRESEWHSSKLEKAG
jgi:catechol 2,3-dioxygenase-like lactoylglutathione lyase family enzyme